MTATKYALVPVVATAKMVDAGAKWRLARPVRQPVLRRQQYSRISG